ncbi:MAG: DUF4139 domain-containing protein, partial [Alistipes sp.]|nr:DUF4139 domain-containing protein [Alistipes sp.]
STPKIDPEEFLQVETPGWTQLDLPEGEAELYFENTRMGSCRLVPDPANDTLRIPMGRNRGLVIERKRDRSDPRTIGWQFCVRNACGRAAKLQLCDQIPVSERSDIVVTAEKTSGGTLDPETGLVSWELHLEPGEHRELSLRYRVDFLNGEYFFVE